MVMSSMSTACKYKTAELLTFANLVSEHHGSLHVDEHVQYAKAT